MFLFSIVCVNGQVMLFGGINDSEGTILVCYSNNYGTVCDDKWDILDARVVCGQTGFNASGEWRSVHVFVN